MTRLAPMPRAVQRPTPATGLWRCTLVSFLILTVVTGVIYPLVVTAIAKLAFPRQADGSLIGRDGNAVADPAAAIGSRLIGQTFDQPQYFWPRPSATTPMPYNAAASSGSNLGPSAIAPVVKVRVQLLRQADPSQGAPIPIDLVTASGSGLDPHISVAAALYQVPRVARFRGVTAGQLKELVSQNTHEPHVGVLGERVVNVLELNLALDRACPFTPSATYPTTGP